MRTLRPSWRSLDRAYSRDDVEARIVDHKEARWRAFYDCLGCCPALCKQLLRPRKQRWPSSPAAPQMACCSRVHAWIELKLHEHTGRWSQHMTCRTAKLVRVVPACARIPRQSRNIGIWKRVMATLSAEVRKTFRRWEYVKMSVTHVAGCFAEQILAFVCTRLHATVTVCVCIFTLKCASTHFWA